MNILAKNTSKTFRHPRCTSCCKANSTGQTPPQNLPEQSGTYNFTHDNLQRLEQVTKDGTILREYGYDLYGNRTKLTEQGNATSYTFNALNQLISSRDASGIETSNTFDKRGNLTEVRAGGKLVQSYTFGALDKLEEARNFSTEQSASYSYSALGQRVGQTLSEASNPTKHIEDTLDLTRDYNNLLERNIEGVNISYLWDSVVLAATDSNNTDSYLLDALGSPLRFGDKAYAFDEFGNTETGTFTPEQPFGYTGYQQDTAANMWFAQARHYDPRAGRFSAEDVVKGSVVMPASLNTYAYCLNAPMKYVDPDGRVVVVAAAASWLIAKPAVGGAIAGAITGGGSTLVIGVATDTLCWGDVAIATVGGAVGGAVSGATWKTGPKTSPALGGAVGYGTTTLISGIVDFADGTTPLTWQNVGNLATDIGKNAAIGAALGYTTGPGGGKILKSASPATAAQIKDGQFLHMLIQALPMFFAEIGRGISTHYLTEFFRDFDLLNALGFPDFSMMSLSQRIRYTMNLNAELQRMQRAWMEFIQNPLCTR